MNHAISDHGEFDFLTPTEQSEADKLIAKFARDAIEANRLARNEADRLFLLHNRSDVA